MQPLSRLRCLSSEGGNGNRHIAQYARYPLRQQNAAVASPPVKNRLTATPDHHARDVHHDH